MNKFINQIKDFFRICKHDFEKISEFTMESEFDVAMKASLHDYDPQRYYSDSKTRKYIIDYQCKKCGSIKRFVEKTAL